MPPQNNPSALVQQKRSVRDLINADSTKLEIAKVLPKHLTPERMTRVALTAIMKTPALLNCTPESLMSALMICSQAGLEPDGRLAHLIPFGNQVQVILDYKGIVALALRNGAESVYADKVCENDEFEAFVENGIKRVSHRPNWRRERGGALCYYAVCKRGGEVDFEVMSLEEVCAIRDRSRAKSSGPWVTDFDEMAKKTVLRRMSKRWDLLPEIRDVIYEDDDTPANIPRKEFVKPLFQATVSAPEPDNGVQPDAPVDTEASANDELTKFRELIKSKGIAESVLVAHLIELGSLNEGAHDLGDAGPELIPLLINNIDRLVVDLKGAKQ